MVSFALNTLLFTSWKFKQHVCFLSLKSFPECSLIPTKTNGHVNPLFLGWNSLGRREYNFFQLNYSPDFIVLPFAPTSPKAGMRRPCWTRARWSGGPSSRCNKVLTGRPGSRPSRSRRLSDNRSRPNAARAASSRRPRPIRRNRVPVKYEHRGRSLLGQGRRHIWNKKNSNRRFRIPLML